MRKLSNSATIRTTARTAGRKKKMATSLNVGETVKLHKGLKGVVKFIGQVHFMKTEMVGLELLEGVGDTNGKKGGRTYFKCADKKGKFVTFSEVSHVYKNRAKD